MSNLPHGRSAAVDDPVEYAVVMHTTPVVQIFDGHKNITLDDNGDSDIFARLQVDRLFADHGVRPRDIQMVHTRPYAMAVATDITPQWAAALATRGDAVPA